MRFVLDTSAFSAAMRREPKLTAHLKNLKPGDVVTVPPVVAEIQYGLERLDNLSRKFQLLNHEKERWLSVIKVLPWTPEASVHFGEHKATLEKKGQLIDDFDIAIGAIALAYDCGVITNNVQHFKRIHNLEVQTWNR